MRNWNVDAAIDYRISKLRIYNTYEELKRKYSFIPSMISFGIYNTYEELKQIWCWQRWAWIRGFIIPMRNWNLLEYFSLNDVLSGFIIPMRNWNKDNSIQYTVEDQGFIIPMRNWNNSNNKMTIVTIVRIYNTYEELKQRWN